MGPVPEQWESIFQALMSEERQQLHISWTSHELQICIEIHLGKPRGLASRAFWIFSYSAPSSVEGLYDPTMA
jgi:hypothetical protein